jgi:hypothetical protein
MESLKNSLISLCSILGIEFIDWQKLSELTKFCGQSFIGILTVYYLILQIKKVKNEKQNLSNN